MISETFSFLLSSDQRSAGGKVQPVYLRGLELATGGRNGKLPLMGKTAGRLSALSEGIWSWREGGDENVGFKCSGVAYTSSYALWTQ